MQLVIGLVAGAIVFGALGFWLGTTRGERRGLESGRGLGLEAGRQEGLVQARTESDARIRSIVEAVRRGRIPPGLTPGSAEAELQRALQEGWAPRETERAAALREAVGRVSAFLEKSVRGPLTGIGEEATPAELRERIGRALGALQDLDFFAKEVPAERQGTDLGTLVQRVSKEFVSDQGIGVRLAMSDVGVRASVNAAALMDALYLVLHNAGRFGDGQTVDLGVARDGTRAKIVVRDRGRGFSEEAFRRAFDPFYSTSDEGLGLGLPHARRVIEAMGGRIELRNVPDGGAEVEVSFPGA
jgi:signal transduction histidine kinase